MKDFLTLAKQRRSIRAYSERPISQKDLDLCMESARFAPSACNSQGWKFIAVNDPETKAAIDKTFSGVYSMNSFAGASAAYIVIVLERTKGTSWAGEKVMGTDFSRIDIGIVCDHIIMQALELGIGSCILGWFDKKKIRDILTIPRNRKIELILALGYPDPTKERLEKYMKKKSEVISFNRY